MTAKEEKIILRGRKVFGGTAGGEALVSKKTLMGWGNVDEKLGFTKERNHPLFEIPFKGKVLVFPEPRGSGGFMSYGRTRQYGTNPAALIYKKGLSLTALTAMIMKVPAVTDLDRDPTEVIETGDYVTVNGDTGVVEVIKKAK